MKMVKSLLLGSAAGLVAMTGAQAADLPVKAKAVQYVKICSLYGAGFYYMPGTDICLKVGGWARFETGLGYNGSFTFGPFRGNGNNRVSHDNNWRVKGTATFDARQQTAYGTLRGYIAVGVSTNNVGLNDIAANYANRWFIQFAGFTIGHSQSFFDFYSIGANQYGLVTPGSDSGDGGWDVFGYTAQFGNGFSATLSAEVQRRTQIINTAARSAATINAATAAVTAGTVGFQAIDTSGLQITGVGYEGHNYPDLVGNLRVDQAWGSAQVMGALHNVATTYYGTTEATGHPSDKMGYALGAGIKLNAPMIAPGDYFQAEVDYTKGASRYSAMFAQAFSFSKYDSGAAFGTLGFGIESDAVFGPDPAALELTTTWGVNAAFTHFWVPTLKSTLWGNYRQVNYNTTANAALCAVQPLAGLVVCDNDWSVWGAGLRTEWSPVKEFQLGLEVYYSVLNTASAGDLFTAPTGLRPAAKTAGPYLLDDQDNWAIRLRVNRVFIP
jgi:hypothetical protein